MSIDQHQSVYREQLLEHLLVSQLLRFAWLYDEARLEVMKPEIDRSGYDIVLEAHETNKLDRLAHSSGLKNRSQVLGVLLEQTLDRWTEAPTGPAAGEEAPATELPSTGTFPVLRWQCRGADALPRWHAGGETHAWQCPGSQSRTPEHPGVAQGQVHGTGDDQ